MSKQKAALTSEPDDGFTFNDERLAGVPTAGGGHVGLRLPSDPTTSVRGDLATKAFVAGDATTFVVYTREAGSTAYSVADVTTTYTNLDKIKGGYAFSIDGGVVESVQKIEIYNGRPVTSDVDLPLGVSFKVTGGMIVEQYVKGDEVDTIIFTQKPGSDLFVLQSAEKTFIDSGTATTLLDVDPRDRMKFAFDAEGEVSQAQRVNAQDGLHAVTDKSVTFTRLSEAPSFVEMVTTRGEQSSFVVYYEGQSGSGVYTEVAHGAGSAVDLPGLQTQVKAAEQLLFAGVTAPHSGWIV
jgi:hypothetical protein